MFRRHADTRVADTESQRSSTFQSRVIARRGLDIGMSSYGQRHRALLRELARVAQQVEERLAQFGHVGTHHPDARGTLDLQHVAVLRDERLHRRCHFLHQLRHVELLQKERHLASFDLREIEDVVDQAEQVFARTVDLLQVGNVAGVAHVLGFLLKHLAVADDRVHRRAQLVAHIRKELALRAVRLVGGFLGRRQLLVFRRERFVGCVFLFEHLLAQFLSLPAFADVEDSSDECPAEQHSGTECGRNDDCPVLMPR